MTREEINALLEAYRDGSIGAPEAAELARLLDGGGEEAAWACAHWAVMGQLGQALDGVDDDAMVASFQERLRAETSGSRIVRGVERLRAADARGRGTPSQRAAGTAPYLQSLPTGILAAAALLLAVVVGLIVLSPGQRLTAECRDRTDHGDLRQRARDQRRRRARARRARERGERRHRPRASTAWRSAPRAWWRCATSMAAS